MIKLTNITFGYKKNKLVYNDYTLTIPYGLTYIVGANGRGKSTLIQLIMGILKPTKGSIKIMDEDISGKKLFQLGSLCGYLLQHYENMLFANTVYEELAFPLEFQNLDKALIDKQVTDTLIKFNLLDKKDCFPLTLSGGEKQKLALATIFMRGVEIFLLDEPTSGLDSDTKSQLVKQLEKIINSGKNVVIVTHDEDLMNELPGRTFYLGDTPLC